jgi:hypothetical protein
MGWDALNELRRWVGWRSEKRDDRITKVPYYAEGRMASTTDPSTWLTRAQANSLPRMTGVGIVLGKLSDEQWIAGIDFDTCIDGDGNVAPWAVEILNRVQSYSEISPSRTGIKIFFLIDAACVRAVLKALGTDDDGKQKYGATFKGSKANGAVHHAAGIEAAIARRYFTVTGWRYPSSPGELREVSAETLLWIIQDYGPRFKGQNGNPKNTGASSDTAEEPAILKRLQQAMREHLSVKNALAYAATLGGGSRSEGGMAVVAALKAIRWTQGATFAALKSAPATAAWAQNQRELERAWQNTTAQAEDVIDDRVPERVDMPTAVLDGALGLLYKGHLRHHPISYAWPTLLSAASVLIPRVKGLIRTNLYTCLVGPTHSGKSYVMDDVLKLLGMDIGHAGLLSAKFGSAEGLVERLKSRAGRSILYDVDEIHYLFAKAGIEHASYPHMLNSLYYQDEAEGGISKKQWIIDCRLSLHGGIAEDKFEDAFGSITLGGLYDRFTFGIVAVPHTCLWRPFESQRVELQPVTVEVDRSVWSAKNRWVEEMNIDPRVAENALRCAYIAACFDGEPLTATRLAPAKAMAEYQMRIRHVLVPNPGDRPEAQCAHRIRTWFQQHAAEGQVVKRNQLYKSLHITRYDPSVFSRCLDHMVFNGELEADQYKQSYALAGCKGAENC